MTPTITPDAADLHRTYPSLYAPSKGYVFIVTYGRSGSTLTMNLLNAIDGYCIRGENAHATAPLAELINTLRQEENFWNRRLLYLGQPGAEWTPAGLGTSADPWYGAERVDVEAFGRRLFDAFVAEVLQPPPGARVAGFKEIGYLHNPDFIHTHLDILRDFFPNVRFLFVTRRHADVLKSSWYRNCDPQEMGALLEKAKSAFMSYAATREGCFHVDHASYKLGPSAFRPLFTFLEEHFDIERVAQAIETKLDH